jgi:tRNA A58 N-methylase Trm61
MRADTHSGSALVRAALISGSLVVCFSCAIAAQHSAKLAPDVPMPQDVVERMLAFAGIGDKDVVVDLGSGDGRVVITAAKKFGAHGIGVEIDPDRVSEARRNAQHEGVSDRVTFRQGDALQADVSEASVVTLYLTSSANRRLRPLLTKQLRPGARIVSLAFGMGDWQPAKTEHFTDVTGTPRTVYLWVADGVVRP